MKQEINFAQISRTSNRERGHLVRPTRGLARRALSLASGLRSAARGVRAKPRTADRMSALPVIQLSRTVLWLGLIVCFGLTAARAQTTAFTYQGRFTDSTVAQPTNGTYNMQFRLFDTDGTQSAGTQSGATQSALVSVVNGIFTVKLDFGAPPFNTTQPRFLEIQVGATVLTPRPEITSTPFSNRALSAANADALSGNCVSCVTNAQINSVAGSKVTGTVANATTAGNVSGVVGIANGGTGSAVQNFVDLSTNQSNIAGDKTFTGTISGNGSGLTNLNGANIAPGSIPPTAVAGGSIALNPQKLALLRFYEVNNSFPLIAVGNIPRALVFDGTFIYVANFLSDTVTRIRASTGLVAGSPIAVGAGPIALVFDGTTIYVANSGSNTVSRF